MESSVTETSDTVELKAGADNSAPALPAEPVAKKSAPAAPPPPAAAPCPRCGGKLTNPEGLGWCPSCGYCRSLDEGPGKTAVAAAQGPHKPSPFGIVEFFEVLGKLPFWLWVLVGGAATVAAISVAADIVLPDESLARALWSSIQVAAGLFGLLAAQIWAFLLIAPESDHVSAKDLILSARLWSMTCRRLPQTQRQVWLGGWSMATVLSAVFLIGGFTYWYQFYHPKKIADKGLIQAIANAARRNVKDKSLEDSLEEFANSQDLTKKKDEKKDKEKVKEDTRPTQDCVIIGYTVEMDRERRKEKVSSLALATLISGRLKYAGVVKRGIEPRASDELLARLSRLSQPEPFLPGLKIPAVIWVKPQVYCEVRQSGFDLEGHLVEPNFKDLLTEQ
jgi:ATP dependent DNA ligase C terminal region